MTQDEKQILMIDLCGRLSYGVKCIDITPLEQFQDKNLWYIDRIRADVMELGVSNCYVCYGNYINIHNIKPYLFPLSSMTAEQFNELKSYVNLKWEHNTLELVEWDNNYKTLEFWLEEIPSYNVIKVFDWLNKNHFDYRGLIEKGLAIDATNKNIY